MGAKCLLVAAAILITTIATADAKTVVFLPPPLTSYVVYHTNVATELASLGHEVWLCLPHFMLTRNLTKGRNIKILDYGEHLGNIEASLYKSTQIVDKFWAGESPQELIGLYNVGLQFMKIARDFLSDKSFVDKVKNLKPDLFVLESIPFNMNMIVLPYSLDIPYALIGTVHDVILSKVPFSPGTTPFPLSSVSDRMSFFDRLKSTLIYIARINFDLFYDSSLVTRFAPHKPYKSINDLAANAEVFIAEVDHILDYPRTTLPNTKLIGGSSASPAKPLVGEFKTFVEQSKNGIIVVSFGGAVVDIPPYITTKMVTAFKQLNLGVVWKVNITSPDPNQFLASRWIPQNDLMGHEKTKLFISHCGKNGQYEALYHGVPILCLPIYGDQGYNSERIVVKQLGLRADMREANADELAAMMKQIIYEGKYSQNMKTASRLYRELYKVPKKEAAYWMDHVMQHGGAYMRSSCQQMPWYQIYVLDVIAFLFAVIIFILGIVYLIIKQCYQVFKGTHVRIKSKKE